MNAPPVSFEMALTLSENVLSLSSVVIYLKKISLEVTEQAQLSPQLIRNLQSVEMSCYKVGGCFMGGWVLTLHLSGCQNLRLPPTKSHHLAHHPNPPLCSSVEFEKMISSKLDADI